LPGAPPRAGAAVAAPSVLALAALAVPEPLPQPVAVPSARHAGRILEPGRGAGAVGAALLARRAGQGGDDPARRDLADRGVGGVRHEDIAGRVDRHAGRITEPGRGAGAVGAAWLARRAGRGGGVAARREVGEPWGDA